MHKNCENNQQCHMTLFVLIWHVKLGSTIIFAHYHYHETYFCCSTLFCCFSPQWRLFSMSNSSKNWSRKGYYREDQQRGGRNQGKPSWRSSFQALYSQQTSYHLQNHHWKAWQCCLSHQIYQFHYSWSCLNPYHQKSTQRRWFLFLNKEESSYA